MRCSDGEIGRQARVGNKIACVCEASCDMLSKSRFREAAKRMRSWLVVQRSKLPGRYVATRHINREQVFSIAASSFFDRREVEPFC